MTATPEIGLHEPTYQWSVRLFRLLRKMVRVNLKLHHDDEQLDAGEIFLFNHFARFETFIPQYFVYEETGAYCRSVASTEFFRGDDAFSSYLRRVGAVPNDRPGLLPFLAAEILRGRKVIMFPEGGMVKDRRVIDESGDYSIYSRAALDRRKQHTGAAVLGLALDAFKAAVRAAYDRGQHVKLDAWAHDLGLEAASELIAAARRPTLIVPANITFYPIRVRDNLLRKGAELLNQGLSRRLSEELLIEGNILLRDTDMDIRLGAPVDVAHFWRWWERPLLRRRVRGAAGLDDLFASPAAAPGVVGRAFAARLRRESLRVRDAYMHRMYTGVSVNLSHLASSLLLALVDEGVGEYDAADFRRMLYVSVKQAQRESSLHLHRSLRNPHAYMGLLGGHCAGFAQLLRVASGMGLVEERDERYLLLPKLRQEHGFDEVRLENVVAVYANEALPLRGVRRVVESALHDAGTITPRELADLSFDDECLAHAWDRQAFHKPRHQEINDRETATEGGAPYLLAGPGESPLAVLLVHGFLASPAELRGLGDRLYEEGVPVFGMRLAGHGTSPWDLRERSYEEWLASVRRGYRIAAALAPRVCMVGFSTGGALSLRLAADRPAGLAGVLSACPPLRFRNRNMRYVPLVHGANRLVRWMSSSEGVMPFRANRSENPAINYMHMPIRGLYELTRMVTDVEAHLPEVACRVAVLQGDADPVVDPAGAAVVHELLGGDKSLTMIEADHHGILHRDTGNAHDRVVDFVKGLLA